MSCFLQMHGHDLLIADNGEDALQKIKDNNLNVTLLITDLIMPKMGGKELALRLLEQNPNLKIILISGYTQDEHTLENLPEDSVLFLRKPFRSEILEQAIQKLLN